MSKILAVADIHIHDYPQRNPLEKYRLHQGRTVAQNIINAGIQHGTDIIVIAGDILEKSVIRPYIQAEVKLFLDTLMSHFKIGYVIWGNHDQDNKGSSQVFTDSVLAVMLPSNLHYADQREVTIDNTRIAFSNWRPEFDLSWINGTVDVLFTHATISYSPSDLFKSQVLDESKFDLAICGDIHKPGQLGKFVSIGTPQKCKMSDQDVATGVVFDCASKTWDWVDLNPSNNLMKFQYTSNRDSEGWDPNSGFWNVYKPDNITINSDSGQRDVKIPAWEEIGNLIDGIVIENNLQDVHGQVLSDTMNSGIEEVDFNFTMTRFYCKNWKSIDEVELFFEEGDRILIGGKNGSGKSSLLTAIKYAFVENRFLKSFIQFGAKDCLTEVEFLYQGSMYKLQRGTKQWGLWINGEPQKYNNVDMFRADARRRFPFIEYIDVFFFDADHHKFIGSMTSERKSEIVSKFFKMDKIDSYHTSAQKLLSSFNSNSTLWKDEINKHTRLLEYINQKLDVLVLPGTSKQDLQQYRQEGLELQQKSKLWADYKMSNIDINTRIDLINSDINKTVIEINGLTSDIELETKAQHLRDEVNNLNSQLSGLGSINSEYSLKLSEHTRIKNEGSRLYSEWESLGNDKTCSSCGQIIQNKEQLQKTRDEVQQRIEELQKELLSVEGSLIELSEKKKSEDHIRTQINNSIREANTKLSEVMTEVRLNENIRKKKKDLETQLEGLNNKLKNLGPMPEQVELPDHFMNTMNTIDSEISIWNTYEELGNDKLISEQQINSARLEMEKLEKTAESLNNYIKLTGPTGKIYEEVLTRLADQFSDNLVRYEVIVSNSRNKDRLDLESFYNNNGNWVAYQACSSGQQTILDTNFLNRIVTRMGLLILDEFFARLDPENHDTCIEMATSMQVGCVLLSSHMESITAFNNKSLNLSLNESGITSVVMI